MKITYDKIADAMYIYMKKPVKNERVGRTLPVSDDLIVDLDKKGNVFGIEILSASKYVSKNVLRGLGISKFSHALTPNSLTV